MTRISMQFFCATALLTASPTLAGGFQEIVTPISESVADITYAAGEAERIAYRIEGLQRAVFIGPEAPVEIDMVGFSMPPVDARFGLPSVHTRDGSFLPYLGLGAAALIPLLGGGGGGNDALPPLAGTPSSPQEVPGPIPSAPLPPIPEPAAWLMMLLGFGALGAVVRADRNSLTIA